MCPRSCSLSVPFARALRRLASCSSECASSELETASACRGPWSAGTLNRVYLYLDESGDFAFPNGRFDAYVQAALICPDTFVDKIEHFVANKRRELGVDELHAAELADEQLEPICRFLAAGPLSMLAQATD